MSFPWFVALRYLRSQFKPAILRLITLLSLLGVAAGVGTLVIALAMNSGFRQAIRDRLLGVTAHINVKSKGAEGISDYRSLMRRLAATPGVRSVTPALYNTVLLAAPSGSARGMVVKGIDTQLEERSDEALHRMVQGGGGFAPDPDGIPALLVGRILAQELRVKSGDYVTLTSPQGSLTPFGMIPRSRRFRITGIFDSGFYDYDANWGFITLPAAQALAGTGDVASLLEVRVFNLDQARQIAGDLWRQAGSGCVVTTWMEENRALFRALSLEKLVTAIFIGLITFVAGLNILVVLTMTVTEKIKDIAVLMTLGARPVQVRNIFVLQGAVIGGLGTLLGLAAGYLVAGVANAWRLIPLNPEVYAIPYVPFHSNALDSLWIIAAALFISIAATLYPALAASHILPVNILRYE